MPVIFQVPIICGALGCDAHAARMADMVNEINLPNVRGPSSGCDSNWHVIVVRCGGLFGFFILAFSQARGAYSAVGWSVWLGTLDCVGLSYLERWTSSVDDGAICR